MVNIGKSGSKNPILEQIKTTGISLVCSTSDNFLVDFTTVVFFSMKSKKVKRDSQVKSRQQASAVTDFNKVRKGMPFKI